LKDLQGNGTLIWQNWHKSPLANITEATSGPPKGSA